MEHPINEAEVWERVRAVSAQLPMPNVRQTTAVTEEKDEPYGRWIEQTQLAAHTYRMLICRTNGAMRRCLQQLYADSCRQLRSLAAMRYVAEGIRDLPPSAATLPMLPTETILKNLCEAALQQAKAYGEAAADSPFSSQLYCLQAAACRQSHILLRLLEQCL